MDFPNCILKFSFAIVPGVLQKNAIIITENEVVMNLKRQLKKFYDNNHHRSRSKRFENSEALQAALAENVSLPIDQHSSNNNRTQEASVNGDE